MRSHTIILFLTTLLLAGVALAWTPEDHEIFRVRDELNTLEGKDTTFYEFLGVSPSASLDEINKQYKKKSRTLHPDKAIPGMLAKLTMPSKKERVKPGPTARERSRVTKEATDRYAHLGVVTNILRSPARERYNHFYRNGFPLWRGSGYYYARLRPGLGSVLLGLFFVFGGVLHYGAMYVSWKRQQDFVNRYVTYARRMAYGNDAGVPGVPGMNGNIEAAQAPPEPRAEAPVMDNEEQGMALNRRQKRMQEKDTKKKPDSKLATRAARLARIKGRDDTANGSDTGVAQPTPAEPEAYGPQGTKKKIIAENGKVLIVDSNGDVFLQQKTAEGDMHDFLLDVSFEILMFSMYDQLLTPSTAR
jgi:hypothetical protein